MTLDLSDPLVLHMAQRNHIPEEHWLMSGEVMVTCDRCGQNWPCETRLRILGLHSAVCSPLEGLHSTV